MTENEIKIGDRERITGDYTHYAESALAKGEVYTVVHADRIGGYDLAVQYTVYSVEAEDLEVVEPLDHRTAFLTRLQSLLREFDAEIIFHCDNKQETIATSIIVGKSESRRNEVYGVTADNIMDFDKE